MVPDRQPRADARRNREKILRTAREAFAASGYGVPLDEIAARAGVGPGTVYRHFPAKEALFQEVITAQVEDLIADARARAGLADPGEAFFGFLARIASVATTKRDLPEAIAITGALQEQLQSAIGVLLLRGQQAGAVRAGVTTRDLIVVLKAMSASILDTATGTADPAQRDRVLAIITDGLRQPR